MKFSKTDMITYAAVLVIVVSLASIGMELTGFATTTHTGVVNVTVDTFAAINFTAAFIDFGNGTVNGTLGATLDTEGSATTNGSWGTTAAGFILQNVGNTNVSLNLSSDKNAQTYLGGASPGFRYKVDNVTKPGSCESPGAGVSYTEFTVAGAEICGNFPSSDTIDEIEIDIQLFIPSDSNTGNLTATVTATGTYI